MALQILSVASAITGLTVTGLTIKDLDEIPQGINTRDLPLMVPDPDEPISEFVVEIDSFGTGADRQMTARYTLNYLLIHSPAGTGRTNVLEAFAGRIDVAARIVDALLSTEPLGGAVDMEPLGPDMFGTLSINGQSYNTCRVRVSVAEFIN